MILKRLSFTALTMLMTTATLSAGTDEDNRAAFASYCQDALTGEDPDLKHALEVILRRLRSEDCSDAAGKVDTTRLTLSEEGLWTLEPLRFFRKIEILDARGNAIIDIEVLRHLENLRSLKLTRNLIANLDPLANLERLRHLELAENRILDASPLADLPGIEHVDLSSNFIERLEFNGMNRNLRDLRVAFNPRLGMLVDPVLPNLQVLDITGTDIESLDFLDRSTELRELFLYKSKVPSSEMELVESFDQLRVLDLSGIAIDDFGFLARLSRLTELRVSETGIGAADLKIIARLEDLRKLDISGNSLANVSNLAASRGIRNIEASRNSIVDAASLCAISTLRRINLASNGLASIDGLGRCEGLVGLTLENNQIADLSPIGNLLFLTRLMASRNEISEVPGIRSLRDLDLSHNELTTFACNGIRSLRSLKLQTPNLTTVSDSSCLFETMEIDLSRSQLDNYSFLTTLGQLSSLTVQNPNYAAIARAIQALPETSRLRHSLKKLSLNSWLRDNPHSLSPRDLNSMLDTLEGLEELSINYSDLGSSLGRGSDEKPVVIKLPEGLQHLSLTYSGIESMRNFENLSSIEHLDITGNWVNDWDGIDNLHNIRNLRLGGQLPAAMARMDPEGALSPADYRIDISRFDTLQIESLRISDARVDSSCSLESLRSLRRIEMLSAPLATGSEDCDPVAAISKLERIFSLSLEDVNIRDMSNLVNLPRLIFARLDRNLISDFTPLQRMREISYLSLSGNNLVTDDRPLDRPRNLLTLNLVDTPLENNEERSGFCPFEDRSYCRLSTTDPSIFYAPRL